MKIIPVGNKVLVLPKATEEHKTEGGIYAANLTLAEGEVVEVSNHLKDIYKVGDIVLYPVKTGTEHFYNGKPHLFLDGREQAGGGDIWAIVSNDKFIQDKGDNL